MPKPPFWGSRVLEKIPFRAILPYLNESALFKVQWQLKLGKRKPDEFKEYLEREARPIPASPLPMNFQNPP